MSDSVDRQRRFILGTAVSGVAALELARIGNAFAQVGPSMVAARAPSSKRLEPPGHIGAGGLKTAYYKEGLAPGPLAILLHCFPFWVALARRAFARRGHCARERRPG